MRKAGWGVQAGAGSSAKQCLGIPEPALCHSWLQHSFTNLASCQGQNQEGSSCVQLARGALGTPVKEMGDTHSTGYKVPQEMDTQPSVSEEPGVNEHGRALHQPRASPCN